MVFGLSLNSRFLRALVLFLAGWLVLETVLMQLIAARIGWGATLAMLSVKGGIGLLAVGFLAARGLKNMGRGRVGPSVGFGVASGVLITLPGILPALIGIALFSPSLRSGLIARLKARGQPPTAPREVDLPASEWRELRRRRLTKKIKTPSKTKNSNALETRPPSV